MKKFSANIVLLIFPFLLFDCGKKTEQNTGQGVENQALGGRFYGGVFRMNESEYIKTLFPPSITDAFSYRIANQIYEGLLKFDQTYLTHKCGLAESYSIDSTGKIYTFKLKKGVFFHDADCFEGGKGREFTAQDVKECFTYICTNNAQNLGFEIFNGTLKGAKKYFDATIGGKKPDFEVEGIKIIDDYTIEFTLEKKSSLFLYNLARPFAYIYPKEALLKYGNDMRIKPVGTGAFYLSAVEEDISMILKKNEHYYGKDSVGNKLPFIDALEIRFLKDRKTELFEFKKGNFDLIYRLPTDQIIEIVESTMDDSQESEYKKYLMQREAEMSTHFLMFNHQHPLFKNINIRKAICFAIDRNKILEYVLQGEGFKAGVNGITPPVFDGYDIEKIKGYDLNIDSAKYYLAKAGYKDGKNFPKLTLDLNSDAERNVAVATEVQKELKDNLNIDIELSVVPMAQHIDNSINGKSAFFRIGWLADFPNPENFLFLFYGKTVPKSPNGTSFPNVSRYQSPVFDGYYEKAMQAIEVKDIVANFQNAEQALMNDAGVVVLWYDEGYRLLQPYVKNFPNNPMQYRDLSEVYFERTVAK